MLRSIGLSIGLFMVMAGTAHGQWWPFCPPGWGYPVRPATYYGFSPYGHAYSSIRTTIFVSPSVPLAPRLALPGPIDERRPDEIPINPDEVWVIRPRPGGLAALPPPRQAPAPLRPGPIEPKPQGFDAPARQAPRPEADKAAENARQNRLGRSAFASGEYGRALERFERATEVAPREPESWMLLAQAQLAMGKYRDATASIHVGLKLAPDWPDARFDIRGLYDLQAVDHAMHLEKLRLAVDRSPQEPALLFLYGYQLWFSDRRAEARPWFEKAAQRAADPRPIERFLR